MDLPRTSQKDHGNKMSYGGGENELTPLESGHLQMASGDPEAQMKSSLLDCTWLEKLSMDFYASWTKMK